MPSWSDSIKHGFPALAFFISSTLLSLSIYLYYPSALFLYIAFFALFLFGFTFVFLRPPSISAQDHTDDDAIYASADGKILLLEKHVKAPMYLDENEWCTKIVIFMNIFNMHWNLSPVNGQISFLSYQSGTLKNVGKSPAWDINEQQWIGVEHQKHGKILFSMVAGLVARRLVYLLDKTKILPVKAKSAIGLILYGSANVLYIPENKFTVEVNLGDKTLAGKTVLAKSYSK